ncbi:ABC transporter substrate-binding protein [Isoptericola halotolerans]|uniref:Polar amino acid transport system substrate-binding protein n=1 Tax=Isoptericola halotolerans TaxID=300560 RepID=A0ABX2A9D1_9MICO|nr:ABC transporter substrate-binding protein [Isoptericola halotolerans]NOV98537.1 polar amino acid transport system substrate-binding protein [Isoptericola halotolerans]
MRARLALPLSALAAVTLLAGCTTASQDLGSTSGSTAGGTADASSSPEAQGFDVSGIEADPELAALVPDDVAADGVLTVGAELSYAPAEFVAADGVTPVGFDVDIAAAIAATLGLESQVEPSTFDAIIPAVGTKYEVGISGFTIDAERLQVVHMVSYFDAGSLFAVASGNPDGIDTDDLCGVVVGVQTGTVQQAALETASADCEAAGGEPVEVLPYDSQADVTTNLAGGKVQAMYADSPVTAYAVTQADGAIETLGDITDSAPYGVVVAQDDTELAEAVQGALQQLMDDGTLTEILDAWGNADGALATAELDPGV